MSIRVVTQYEKGVLFRLGRVKDVREPGLRFIIPVIDRLRKVSMRIVTMPIQSQGIITRDNVSVDIAAVAYFRVVDAVKSVVVIENVGAAIDQIAQTTLRNVVGQHTLDETLADTEVINANIRQILDVITLEWGVEVTLVELKDIQLPDSMKRAMARQAEAEREKRAKIIAAEGESLAAAALGDASDTMMAHPLALQLRNLQTLVELGVDKNTTVVFPAQLMSAIGDIGAFFARETAATATTPAPPITVPSVRHTQAYNGGTKPDASANQPACVTAGLPQCRWKSTDPRTRDDDAGEQLGLEILLQAGQGAVDETLDHTIPNEAWERQVVVDGQLERHRRLLGCQLLERVAAFLSCLQLSFHHRPAHAIVLVFVGQRVTVRADSRGRLEPGGRRQVAVLVHLEQLDLQDLRDPLDLALHVTHGRQNVGERRLNVHCLLRGVSGHDRRLRNSRAEGEW